MKFTVETNDILAAIRSVGVHAFPKPDVTSLHRIRIHVGPQNVTVTASNLVTSALAIASVWNNDDGELGAFDIPPADARSIIALFKPTAAAKDDDDSPEQTLTIEVDAEHLTITDTSGLDLGVGVALQLNRYPTDENFPHVAQRFAAQHGAPVGRPKAGDRVVVAGAMLQLFCVASSVYRSPLVIDPWGGGPLTVAVSASFLGLMNPQRPDEELTAKLKGFHAGWTNRFADLGDPELIA